MDELIAALERKAAERAEAILAEARERAGRIVAEAERELERLEAARLAERERGWRDDAARRFAEVRGEAARRVLEARAEALGRVRERAVATLDEAGESERYLATVPRRLERALGYLDGTEATVRCRPAVADAFRRAGDDLDAVRVAADRRAPAGFRLVSGDDRVVVDGALGGDLARRWPELAVEIARRIEEHGG